MKQKTAVEWLFDNLKSHFKHDGDLLEVVCMSYEIAKQKEKEQIIGAYKNGTIEGIRRTNNSYYNSVLDSEEYYIQTYLNDNNL